MSPKSYRVGLGRQEWVEPGSGLCPSEPFQYSGPQCSLSSNRWPACAVTPLLVLRESDPVGGEIEHVDTMASILERKFYLGRRDF